MELRTFRISKGEPTYRAMAELAHVSHTALSLADRGKKLPTWTVTEAYLRGCGVADAEIGEWRERYDSTRTAIALRHNMVVQPRPGGPAPKSTPTPSAATTAVQVLPTLGQLVRRPGQERLSHLFSAADLVAALNDLVSGQGYNLAELTRRVHAMSMPRIDAPRAWHYLTTGEVRRALTGTTLPHRNVMIGIVNACGGSAVDVEAWTAVWQRLHRDERRAQAKLDELLDEIRAGDRETRPVDEPQVQTRPAEQPEAIFAEPDAHSSRRGRTPKIPAVMAVLVAAGLLVTALLALPFL